MNCPSCNEISLPDNALFCFRCGCKISVSSCTVSGDTLLSPGTIIQNRYKIEMLLGQGGWGAVYKASYVSVELGRIFGPSCAIKEMKPSPGLPLSGQKLTEQFEKEAQILVQLKHEHIPRIIDYFSHYGRYYIVMEFIEGKDLETLMEENRFRPFPEEKVLQWGIEICQVLDYLHTRKPKPFIYRDLKPANIILDLRGKITIVDFGITRIFTTSDSDNLKVGTPGYAPPEQYRGAEEPVSDIYAFGVTLHYLLSGRNPAEEKPFTCQDYPLGKINPSVSREVENIINRAVQNDLKNRYNSSSDMLYDMTSIFWKNLSPGEKESFKWLSFSKPPVPQVAPAFTAKLNIEDLDKLVSPEVKVNDRKVSREIVFASPEKDCFLKFSEGRKIDSDWYELRMKAERLSLTTGFNTLMSLSSVPVVPYTHQRKAALDALKTMRGRVLLADEVGLGKTIEAGLIMKELKMRGLIRKILILVPPSLTTQWQEEMEIHFNEKFFLQKSEEDWMAYDHLIASIDTARRDNHSEKLSCIKYDLIIIDEAHKLKNRKSKAWKLINSLNKRYILMLTATPVQNNLEELFNLITLLKPGQLNSVRDFRKRFVNQFDKRIPANAGELRRLLGEVMIRNRRASVDVYLPPRRAGIYYLTEYPAETRFRLEVTGFLRDYYRKNTDKKGIVLHLIQLQKALGSSTSAVLDSLRKWRENFAPSSDEYTKLTDICSFGEEIGLNRKTKALLEIAGRTSDKIIVFTEFISTQYYLKEILEKEGYTVALFNGQMDIKEKDRNLDYFKKDVQILISTQSGSEGKNLQFCHLMVNYDLPWNPMRLEQRIGRLHRLTQEREVFVFNFSLLGTFEGYILYLLSEKIKMFELVIGELDLILGDFEEDATFEQTLQRIWLDSISDEQIMDKIEQLGDKLVDARNKFQYSMVADKQLSSLFES